MAIGNIFRPFATVSMIGLLESCSAHIDHGHTPSNVDLFLFESRINGAGSAPDSIKIYMTDVNKVPKKEDTPIFEGQDVGKVCYD